MAGQQSPSQAGAVSTPYQDYALPPRRRPRRTAGTGAAALLGLLAGLAVVAILGFAAFGGTDIGTTAGGGRSAAEPARAAATASRLYGTGTPVPVDCRLPRISEDDAASMRVFMDELTDCLDDSWRGVFGAADLDFAVPSRVFWVTPGRGPCGSYPHPGAAAFYCAANDTMYVGLEHVVRSAGDEPVENFAVYARVIAHEYGHHVQELAGILGYGHRQMDRAADTGARNAISRRIELQAQCLAGVFLAAERESLPMTRAQYRAMIVDVRGRGDDHRPVAERDHGSARNYAGWVRTGFLAASATACNTWTVAAESIE